MPLAPPPLASMSALVARCGVPTGRPLSAADAAARADGLKALVDHLTSPASA